MTHEGNTQWLRKGERGIQRVREEQNGEERIRRGGGGRKKGSEEKQSER